MNNLTEVVKNLIVINVIVFFGVHLLPSQFLPPLELYSPFFGNENFHPYQLITHMFMHANFSHLLFNMLGLYFLGPTVENYIGGKKFFILYFASGILALALQLGANYIDVLQYSGMERAYYLQMYRMLGASGAVYGVMAGFATLFPNVRLMLLIPPIPVKAKYLIAGLVAYDLFSGISGGRPGIATFAHVGGALMGFLLIQYWKKTGFR